MFLKHNDEIFKFVSISLSIRHYRLRLEEMSYIYSISYNTHKKTVIL